MTKVLFVDDDQLTREVILLVLEESGHQVDFAQSAEEAMDVLKESSSYVLVILDYHMSKINGLDCARLIRQDYPTLSIVVSSGFLEEKIVREVNHIENCQYLAKPYDPQILIDLIESSTMSSESK